MSLLCIAAAGVLLAVPVPAEGFELRWVHSVERTEWRERWVPTADGLRLLESRVQGSGAGMEPAEGAVLENGWWVDRTPRRTVTELSLPLSPYAAPYQLCVAEVCRRLDGLLPPGAETATLSAEPPTGCSGAP
ncbi:DUF1850 domain-containing protein [Novispirillum sp. DQ9]|uniref:DUF1850 domain-containing protein n=1 Tax=Novispirillum sp. DQ9 TaxID=3398612 RepID=UPI003C799051